MSREQLSNDLAGNCDAIVLAGSRDSLIVEHGGRQVGKSLLPLGGRALVRGVVETLLDTRGIGRLYVVGDLSQLRQALDGLPGQQASRLELVAEGASILENCFRAFFHHLLPARGLPAPACQQYQPAILAEYYDTHPEARPVTALVVTADLPFISSGDIEEFLRRCSSGAALSLGVVDHDQLKRLVRLLQQPEVLDAWKLGGIPLRRLTVRLNNLFLVRPGLADPRTYGLLDSIYSHRRLLHRDGRANVSSWRAVTRAVLRHCRQVNPWWRWLRALVNVTPTAAAGLLARSLFERHPRWAWLWRLLLGQRDLEFLASLLLGAEARMVLVNRPGPAIDIDVEDSYRFLAADGERGFRQLRAAIAQLAEAQNGAAGVP